LAERVRSLLVNRLQPIRTPQAVPAESNAAAMSEDGG
jgi:hypothetical protein